MKIEVYAFIEGFISDMEKAGAIEEEPGRWVCRNNLNEIHRDGEPAVLIVSDKSICKKYFNEGRFIFEAYMLIASPRLRGGVYEVSIDKIIT